MKISEYPRSYQECWVVFNGFRQLGFDAAEIYVGVSPILHPFSGQTSEKEAPYLQLKTQGQEFTVTGVPLEEGVTKEQWLETWPRFCEAVTLATDEEFEQVKANTTAGTISPSLLTHLGLGLHAKGIKIPNLETN